MAGILVEYARFVEVQQRRARIGAELGRAHQAPALRPRIAVVDEAVEAEESAATVIDVKKTRGPVDVR